MAFYEPNTKMKILSHFFFAVCVCWRWNVLICILRLRALKFANHRMRLSNKYEHKVRTKWQAAKKKKEKKRAGRMRKWKLCVTRHLRERALLPHWQKISRHISKSFGKWMDRQINGIMYRPKRTKKKMLIGGAHVLTLLFSLVEPFH